MVVGVTSEAHAEGRFEDGVWKIDGALRRTRIRLPRGEQRELQRIGPLEDVVFVDARGLKAKRTPFSNRQLAIMKVTTPDGVTLSSPDLEATIRADLTVVYLRDWSSEVSGSIHATRGWVNLFGRRWEIARADAALENESPPNPNLQIRLERDFRTAIVFVALDGPLASPRLTLSSDPAGYTEAELLGFVLGGDPQDPSIAEQPLQARAVGLASGMLVGELRSRVSQAMPIDVLNFDTQKLEVGKWITQDLFVGYRYRFGTQLDTRNVNEGNLEYRFLRHWMLDAYFGDRAVGGADVLWTKRY
jgi:autotransporter translocation and assembly factor TamB